MPPKKRDYANKITDLQPQKSNANKHKEHGERLLRKSVQDYGLADGITVAANNEAISGSLRIETLADVMPDVKIQVVETYGDTLLVNKRMDIPSPDTKQGRALSVASNQVAYTDYNPDGKLLKEWADEDVDIRKMFADSEWRELTGEEISTVDAEPQVDRAAELLEKWKVETGQLWQLGAHRLICGDCTDAAVVARVMGGEGYSVLTDPPYNIGFNYESIDDKMSQEDYEAFCLKYFDNIVPNSIGAIITPGPQNDRIYPKPRDRGIWYKPYAMAGASVFHTRHCEPILFYGEFDGKRASDFFEYSSGFPQELRDAERRAGVTEMHAPAKSMPLWMELVKMLKGDCILDVFNGTGTTILACQNSSKKARVVEISPAYVAVALERFAQAFPNEEIKKLE